MWPARRNQPRIRSFESTLSMTRSQRITLLLLLLLLLLLDIYNLWGPPLCKVSHGASIKYLASISGRSSSKRKSEKVQGWYPPRAIGPSPYC